MVYESSFKAKLIYVFRINDEAHKGCVKVGDATADDIPFTEMGKPNSKSLTIAAKKRIDQYTKTAGIKYELLYAELALFVSKKRICGFRDYDVHNVLVRSGIKKKSFTDIKAGEWFKCDLETIKNAIAAVKEGRDSLNAKEISHDKDPIIFRPEQLEAISLTKKRFKTGKRMLWNAKMRFGKTLSALQVVKEMNFRRTLILTHRPVVNESWFEDFVKIFSDRDDFLQYGSKEKGNSFDVLENYAKREEGRYVYFASMQDLRGSEKVGGNFDKNKAIFKTNWDFIIIDEAHEGTTTELGNNVIEALVKEHTKVLHLSGTPFNLMEDFDENEIYTWDYVMEQQAKANWDIDHPGDPNPYAGLPKLNIFTFDLGKLIKNFSDGDMAFNFHEFFRVAENEEFVHLKEVNSFLNLICKKDEESNYPYSTEDYRNNFRHSLWMLPGVKEAKALSKLLKSHKVFGNGNFEIVNVAGNGDEEESYDNALAKVQKAIGENPEENYTITLSCGRLTTGVSVPAWTAVFMLTGSANTAAAGYMQTIFRVQTPANINGKIKEQCFVFDFAPDRTLKVLAQTAKVSAKAGKTKESDRKIMGNFLNFCPVIAFDGTRMGKYDVERMLGQLKRVYVERVVSNGFEDACLYNDKLLQLSELELKQFDKLKGIIGSTKAMKKTGDVDVNSQGLSSEEYDKTEKIKKKKDRTSEELALLEKRKEQQNQCKNAVSILRGISIRMPLLIYGADLKNEETEITIDNFASLVDEASWVEFMPKGVTKELFEGFKKYYEEDIFREAGKRIRELARAADKMTIEQRIERIGHIFNNFRNPDKETVLTPWRVVNMHLSLALGGYVFFDDKFENMISQPHEIKLAESSDVFAPDSKILEINSKSGLYPLYMAYSIFRATIKKRYGKYQSITLEMQQQLWDQVVADNIFVVCKTPMAEAITRRTLMGFRKGRVNVKSVPDLERIIDETPERFIKGVKQGKTFWKANQEENMEFKAVVGNPPYQIMDGGNGVSAKAIYNEFVDVARKMAPNFVSLITPARWYVGGKGLDSFRKSMLSDKRLKALFDFANSKDCFKNVDIAGGLCFFLWDKNYSGQCNIINCSEGKYFEEQRDLNEYEVLIRENRAISIVRKVLEIEKKFLIDRVSSRKPFGLPTNYEPKQSGIPCWFIQKIGLKYAAKKDIDDTNGYLNKWKFIVPKSPIAGQTDFTKPVGFYYDGNTKIAAPGECCTESYIILGAFDSKEETLNFKSYIFTKIIRFLLLQAVVSQDITKQNYLFVPDLCDYKQKYTDEMLKKKWKISDSEWLYIDSRICNIKGM